MDGMSDVVNFFPKYVLERQKADTTELGGTQVPGVESWTGAALVL